MGKDTLTVTDNRTGKTYELPIEEGAIRALDLRQVKTGPDDFGLMTYDPAFTNTASCKSRITFIDGDKGILLYRGYPIQDLAEKSNYLETSFLILNGELPSKPQYEEWEEKLFKRPPVTVPAITIASDFDGPNADGKAYASKYTGKYSHRVLKGIGHNVPQEAPEAFAKAVVDVDAYSR